MEATMNEGKILHIKYPTGYMDIRVENFFPATLDRARMVFRLMHEYSSEEDIKMIYDYLWEKIEESTNDSCEYSVTLSITTDKKEERKAAEGLRKAKSMKKRTERNLELLKKITKHKEE